MGDLIAPQQRLAVAFGQSSEVAPGPERFTNIADGSLDAAFLIARAHLTGLGLEVIVTGTLEDSRMKLDEIAAPLLNDTAQIVVQNRAG